MAAHLMLVHVESIGDVTAVLERLCEARVGALGTCSASAITMNFVVFVDDAGRRDWVLERAALVAEKHPSRTIVLDSTGATTGIDVSCSARKSGGASVLNERIDIGVGTLGHAAIVGMVRHLTVAGCPTVLWWSGACLLDSHTFSELAEFSEVVLVDSSGGARDEATLRELTEFQKRYPRVAVHDLAFMRLAPWQDMIAQFFDDPALRDDLFSLRALEIESGSQAEALYLGGWLGSRISWEAIDRHTFRTLAGAKVAFTSTARGESRRVLRVALSSADSRYVAALDDDDENVARLTVEGNNARPCRLVPLHAIDNTSLIERAILASPQNAIFESTLETVRGLLGSGT
jgi:glucose-6-phosphate dehydrogenase assembly protein OpcA